MSTCGYICPKCEGRKFLDDGTDCDWCKEEVQENTGPISDETWIKKVHEGKCCGD